MPEEANAGLVSCTSLIGDDQGPIVLLIVLSLVVVVFLSLGSIAPTSLRWAISASSAREGRSSLEGPYSA